VTSRTPRIRPLAAPGVPCLFKSTYRLGALLLLGGGIHHRGAAEKVLPDPAKPRNLEPALAAAARPDQASWPGADPAGRFPAWPGARIPPRSPARVLPEISLDLS
jgi:hypothetical protein